MKPEIQTWLFDILQSIEEIDGFDWGNYPYAFKQGNNARLVDITEFQNLTGQEMNAIRIDHNTCFDNFDIPNPPPASVPF